LTNKFFGDTVRTIKRAGIDGTDGDDDMAHEFAIREEITLAATPEQVWEAIATGPGIDSWFMGRNEVEPRAGGTATMAMPGFAAESTITAHEPGKHYATRSQEAPDGTFMAFEYLIEARDSGSTTLRFVHSGLLGDDWEAEYDALRKGDYMYLLKLASYLKHFAPRTVTGTVFLPGPRVPDAQRAWSGLLAAFGLTGTPEIGDPARLTVDGLPATDGVVEFVREPSYLGVRAGDSLYTMIYGFHDTVVVEESSFGQVADATPAWQTWLATAFGWQP
jgi:uncharacterized protein YndB with AHSA1/START domain